MRFLDLQLKAFGCFTGVTLDLSRGESTFQLIYGENEAGKSTALRGVTGLLYGIPAQSNDNFLHAYPQLRLGATLQGSGGLQATFVRRKGNKDTLLDEQDRPVPEADLQAFLGAVDAEQFRGMFGLDHDTLVKGGRELLAGKGALAESLFQAGTGVADLRTILRDLQAQAEALFKKQGQNQVINAAVRSFEETRTRIGKLSLKPSEWTEQQRELQRLQGQQDEILKEQRDLTARKTRLDRLATALEPVGRWLRVHEALQALGTVAPLPADAPMQRTEAQRRQREAGENRKAREAELAALLQELELLIPNQKLLDRGALVVELHQRLGSYLKEVKELLPRLTAEQRSLEAQALLALQAVRPGAALGDSEGLRLGVEQTTRIEKLIREEARSQKGLRVAEEQVADLTERHRDREADLRQLPPLPDREGLRSALQRAQSQLHLLETQRTDLARSEQLETQAGVDLARLGRWTGLLPELETLPVPLPETLRRFQADFEALSQAEQRVQERQRETEHELGGIGRDLEALRSSGEAPSEERLAAARDRRSEGWRLVLKEWREGGAEPAELAGFAPAGDLPQAYMESVSAADTVADRLRREAARVSQVATLTAAHQHLSARLELLREEAAGLNENRSALVANWALVWKPAGITPDTPQEMLEWLEQYRALVERSRSLRELRQEIAARELLLGQLARQLGAELQALAESPAPEGDLRQLADHAARLLKPWDEEASRRAGLEDSLRTLAADRDLALRKRSRAQEERDAWTREWKEAAAILDLRNPDGVDEAAAVMKQLREHFEKLDLSRVRAREVSDLEAETARFARDVAALADEATPEVSALAPEVGAAELFRQWEQARSVSLRRDSLRQQGEALEAQIRTCDEQEREARQALQSLLELAGCSDVEALQALEERSAQYLALVSKREELELTLSGMTGGATLEHLLLEVRNLDPDALPFEQEKLEAEIGLLASRRSQVDTDLGAVRERIKGMEAGENANEAAAEAQSQLAALRPEVEQFLRITLAREMLSRYVEHYRQQNQSPVIQAASDLFAAMTRGSFGGISASFDEQDRPVLVGVRPDAKEVYVEGMSEGTRDQLYLALRLASLEHRGKTAEALPFVVDDILVNSDDARARAILKLLGEFSQHTQVLFFTHHSRIIELAQAAIPPELLAVHDLGQLRRTAACAV